MTQENCISVAVPVYNEEEVLPELLRRLRSVLDQVPGEHEIVLVDDGSTDNSIGILEREAAEDDRIVVVQLSRNFGHQAAITAALEHVSGDVVVVMDGDLQDPPEAIPQLLDKHLEGYEVVYAKRSARKEPWYLRLSYFVFYRLIAALSNVSLPRDAGDFALLSRRVVETLRRAPERHRYVRGLRAWVGFSQVGVEVERSERHAGKSKYGPIKLIRLALDGIMAFSTAPIRLASLLGFVAFLGALVYIAYAIYAKLALDQSPQGFTALIVAIIFSLGVQMMFLGVIGEYIGRIYEEVKGRPHYIINKVIKLKQK